MLFALHKSDPNLFKVVLTPHWSGGDYQPHQTIEVSVPVYNDVTGKLVFHHHQKYHLYARLVPHPFKPGRTKEIYTALRGWSHMDKMAYTVATFPPPL